MSLGSSHCPQHRSYNSISYHLYHSISPLADAARLVQITPKYTVVSLDPNWAGSRFARPDLDWRNRCLTCS